MKEMNDSDGISDVRERLVRSEVHLQNVQQRLHHIDKTLEELKGNVWKLLAVAGLSAGGGSAVAKFIFTGSP